MVWECPRVHIQVSKNANSVRYQFIIEFSVFFLSVLKKEHTSIHVWNAWIHNTDTSIKVSIQYFDSWRTNALLEVYWMCSIPPTPKGGTTPQSNPHFRLPFQLLVNDSPRLCEWQLLRACAELISSPSLQHATPQIVFFGRWEITLAAFINYSPYVGLIW